ncbi:MAG: copper-binding protein [Sulfuricella denitrificans]|nr:copper-binding protein [Sulfuricella denitrificans]
MKRFTIPALLLALIAPLAAQADSGHMMNGNQGMPMMNEVQGAQPMNARPAMAGRSEGEIRKVDPAAGKLTIRHGPLENLGMPGMTMVFRVKDPEWLKQVKTGDRVKFVAERVNGTLTVTTLEPEK